MKRLRRFGLAVMAVAVLGVGSLGAATPASAMRYSCTEGSDLFYTYLRLGDYWYSRGFNALSTYYYNQARSVAENTYCG